MSGLIEYRIPAYGRPKDLKTAIESIRANDPMARIVVSEDPSLTKEGTPSPSYDDIHRMVKDVNLERGSSPAVIHHRSEAALGFDRGILRVTDPLLEPVKSPLIHLHGDDDLMRAGMPQRVKDEFHTHPNASLILLNSQTHLPSGEIVTPRVMLGVGDRFYTSGAEFFFQPTAEGSYPFLENSGAIQGIVMLIMSADVVNAELWEESRRIVEQRPEAIGWNMIHLVIAHHMIAARGNVDVVNDTMIDVTVGRSAIWPNNIWETYRDQCLTMAVSDGLPADQVERWQRQISPLTGKEYVSHFASGGAGSK